MKLNITCLIYVIPDNVLRYLKKSNKIKAQNYLLQIRGLNEYCLQMKDLVTFLLWTLA